MKEHKVLVLEDSLSDQLSLEMILEQFPTISTQFTKNSEEFLKKISDDKIQLVIIDIVLKEDLTGLDLAKLLPNSPIWLIICSAHNCKQYYEEFKSLEFTKFYVQKPIDEYVLRTHLDSFIFSKNQILS
jgi:DNA-binding NtrC family response regulator